MISIGLNLTMFMGFLNAGGITHALGVYVLLYLLSGMVIGGDSMGPPAQTGGPLIRSAPPVQPTVALAAVQSTFVSI